MRPIISICTLFLGTMTLLAQTHEMPPATPTQTATTHDAPLNPALPTLFIVGDSTARNNSDLGWADHLAPLFDTARINIANRAIAGRSSRTYINEGHWQSVLAEMKPGDYLLIQMGHNDGASDAQGVLKDIKNRASIHSLGDETIDVPLAKPYTAGPDAGKSTETVHTYGWYMRKMIDDAKSKGVHPALLTLTVRNIWTLGPDNRKHIERDMGFTTYIRQIAAQEHIPVVDMATIAANAFDSMGESYTATLFPIDHTHTNAIGADINAISVARALAVDRGPLADFEMGH